jgi:hypothetical protein
MDERRKDTDKNPVIITGKYTIDNCLIKMFF